MGRRVALVLALLLAAPVGAPAGHDCVPDPLPAGFRTCGDHPVLDDLPLRFSINMGSRPAGLSAQQVTAAAAASVAEWNRAWPLPTGDLACPLVCLGGSTGADADPTDGVNVIVWDDEAGACGPVSIAIACVRAPGHRITDVDIVLSPERAWYQPRLMGTSPGEPVQVVAGEAAVVYPDLGDHEVYDLIGGGRGRYDLQSVLTHEIGHAIGLLDIGNPTAPYPSALSDAPVYAQTMYRWYNRGTTYKRTLAEGDLLGLMVIALQVLQDD